MSTTANNSPIEQLIAEYEAEMCDFSNTEFLVMSADRYVQTMRDGQVRCLLHAMANKLREPAPEVVLPYGANPNVEVARPILKNALINAVTQVSNVIHNNKLATVDARHWIRKTQDKHGNVKHRLYFKFICSMVYNSGMPTEDAHKSPSEPRYIVEDQIKRAFSSALLPRVKMYITSGSAYTFSARLVVEGDDDFAFWVR